MPLYIKDPEVDELLVRYLALCAPITKTDAVKQALRGQLEALAEREDQRKRETLADRIALVQVRAARAGFAPFNQSQGIPHVS